MAKKINEMTSDDLMTLPDDIEGIVLDVQGRQKQNATPIQRPQEEPVAEPTPRINTEHKPTLTASQGGQRVVEHLSEMWRGLWLPSEEGRTEDVLD